MKLTKMLSAALALTMAASCSDRDVDPANGLDAKTEELAGYIAVQINLPQTPQTRAENDNFDDGTPGEYHVNNAAILLFEGTSEGTATFVGAKALKKGFAVNPPANDNITATFTAVAPLSASPADANDLYALVMLNYDGILSITSTDDTQLATACTLGGTNNVTTSTTYSAIREYMAGATAALYTAASGDAEATNFFMTNAPLSSAGTTGTPEASGITTLAKMDKTMIKSTEAEAQNHVAGCVYVERALAKVTTTLQSNAVKLALKDGEGNDKTGVTVTATVNYQLLNTNSDSYIIRNVDFGTSDGDFRWDYAATGKGKRMIGNTAVNSDVADASFQHSSTPALYRTYWCKDANYNATTTGLSGLTSEPTEYSPAAQPIYCRENTFTVGNQTYGNTTIALFKVSYTVTGEAGKTDNNLYTRNGDRETVYLSAADAMAPAITSIFNDPRVAAAVESAADAGQTVNVADAVEVELEVNSSTKEITVKEVKGKTGVTGFTATAFDNAIAGIKADLIAVANDICSAQEYTGGVAYYYRPIMHFGDTYCPLPAAGITGTTAAQVYGSSNAAQNYLGRYGVVRNNWYELEIQHISGLGSAAFPQIPAGWADDNNEDKKYFGVEIHILSWAKRTQGIKF